MNYKINLILIIIYEGQSETLREMEGEDIDIMIKEYKMNNQVKVLNFLESISTKLHYNYNHSQNLHTYHKCN